MISQNRFPYLLQRNIFCIPMGDFWDVNPERVFAIYAPFCGLHMLADSHQAEALEKAASSSEGTHDVLRTLETLSRDGNLPIEKVHYNTNELYQIDILSNNTCNFHCIYCYSAAGRSNTKLRIDQITPLIDYLFDGRHNPAHPYDIHFSGGGEPLLSLDIIHETIDYIKQAHSHGNRHPYRLGIVTNGSLLDAETAEYLHSEGVEIVVSFEILEELQNKERGSYVQVVTNLETLLKKGIPFAIRTTFTHESVSHMCDMIDELHVRFPGLNGVVFDTVLSSELFETPEELEAYYAGFLENFYLARELGKTYSICVGSLAAEPLLLLRDRTCAGKFVLTPWGTLTACSRVSSPIEKHYDQYEYGCIYDGQLYIDQNRFSTIMHDCNIYTTPACQNCFAKWNCGGGCRLFHHSFDERFEKVRCDFVRTALKRELLDTLGRSFHKSTGRNLEEFIRQKIILNEI